jgi:hypothetical protein
MLPLTRIGVNVNLIARWLNHEHTWAERARPADGSKLVNYVFANNESKLLDVAFELVQASEELRLTRAAILQLAHLDEKGETPCS